ncbi:MAG: TRAP transporter small permease [Bacteroidota bacterium]
MKAKVDQYVGAVLVALMVLICLDVLWGVFTRYALGGQASWTEELARFLLIWIGTLGAAYASGQRMHLAIDLLTPRLSPQGVKQVQRLIIVFILGFVIMVMLIGGTRLIYLTFHLEQNSAALRVPMGLVYAVIPLSGLLIVYYKLNELFTPQAQA